MLATICVIMITSVQYVFHKNLQLVSSLLGCLDEIKAQLAIDGGARQSCRISGVEEYCPGKIVSE